MRETPYVEICGSVILTNKREREACPSISFFTFCLSSVGSYIVCTWGSFSYSLSLAAYFCLPKELICWVNARWEVQCSSAFANSLPSVLNTLAARHQQYILHVFSLPARDLLTLKEVKEHFSVVLWHILELRGRIALDMSWGFMA